MKNATEHAKALRKLLKQLSEQVTLPSRPSRTPEQQLVHAMLCWEATHKQADAAYGRLFRNMLDLNDVRVSDTPEIVSALGPRYPRAEERAGRLKSVLHDIYRRQYAVDLSSLADKPKRDVRAYLDSLEGMPPYVSASVALLSFEAHAIPVDEQLLRRLREDGVAEPKATLAEVQGFLEHQIRAEDTVETFYLLRAYVEGPIQFAAGSRGRGRKSAGKSKKTTKKTTKRSASGKRAARV